MKNDENIPKEDVILAERLNDILFGSEELHDTDDPLLTDLLDFKNHQTHESDNDYLDKIKADNWIHIRNAISKEGSVHDNQSGSLHYIRHYWKIAAVILFAVLLSLFYYQQSGDSLTKIASAGSTIENVMFDDGSEVTLRPNSILYAVSQTDTSETYRLEGEAYFSVVPEKNRTFTVETGQGFVQVIGTRFNIRTWQQETAVFLETGSVKLSSKNFFDQVILEPGQLSVINENFTIADPENTSKEYYASWQQSEIIFNNRKAGSIFKELEFHFSINIEAGSETKNTILGGSVSLDNLNTSLQNLGVVLGGKFVMIKDDSYQFVATE